MTRYTFQLTDSLEKVLPACRPAPREQDRAVLLQNQKWAFQLAYTCANDDFGETSTEFRVRCSGPAAAAAKLRRVDLVPCDYPCHGTWDENYLTTQPGLLPDLLVPLDTHEPIRAMPAQWRSLWITVDASRLQPGDTELCL